jgi:hypothetical protein
MYGLTRSPTEPEGTDYEEGTRNASEREAAHFFVLRPRTLIALGAKKDLVPGEVHACGYDGADADGKKGEADFAAVEVIDGGEDDGVGLKVDVENGVCRTVSALQGKGGQGRLTCVTQIQAGEQNQRLEAYHA